MQSRDALAAIALDPKVTAAGSEDNRSSSVALTLYECNASGASCSVLGNKIKLNPGSKAQVHLLWKSIPRSVLLVKKQGMERSLAALKQLGLWLVAQQVKVFVEQSVKGCQQFVVFDSARHEPDFAVTLGGDGTLLHLNSLFQQEQLGVPPVAAFAMGSLGFLTPYDVQEVQTHCQRILNGHQDPLILSLRMRICCELWRHDASKPEFSYQVLNECLIDRGGSPIMSSLELFVDDKQVTLVQADGLIVSTPTGSTAYSMSAGGSMVAPTVPAILITPVCPHTLSFRPVVLPDTSLIRIRVPSDARSTTCVSFDSSHRLDLQRGDEVRCYMSQRPFPTINAEAFNHQWFKSIVSKLHWNVRRPQECTANL